MIRNLFIAGIMLFYFAVPNARPDFSRFNCHDSESYLALAYNLTHDNGYTRSLQPDLYVPHKTWPPGMPMLFAPVMALSGEHINWFAVKATAILIGLLGILATWRLVENLTQRRKIADLAALIVALNPFYWDFSHQVMSEVPSITFALWALLLIDRMLASRSPRLATIVAVGIFSGLGMLIRGNLCGLALVPLAYLIGPRATSGSLHHKLAVVATFGAAFTIPFVLWSFRNHGIQAEGLDGLNQIHMILQNDSDPSQVKSPAEMLAQIAQNMRIYGIYRIPEQILPAFWANGFDWNGSGWLALLLVVVLFFAIVPVKFRTAYFGLDCVIWPFLVLSQLYSEGGSQRYWVLPCVLLSILLVIRLYERFGTRWQIVHSRAIITVVLFTLIPNLLIYVVQHERKPYNTAGPWQQLAQVFERVEQFPLQTQGVLTPNMHAFELMTGYRAPMAVTRYNPIFDHMIARDDGRGPQPPKGSVALLSVAPWSLYRLPHPAHRTELLEDRDYSFGIPIDP